MTTIQGYSLATHPWSGKGRYNGIGWRFWTHWHPKEVFKPGCKTLHPTSFVDDTTARASESLQSLQAYVYQKMIDQKGQGLAEVIFETVYSVPPPKNGPDTTVESDFIGLRYTLAYEDHTNISAERGGRLGKIMNQYFKKLDEDRAKKETSNSFSSRYASRDEGASIPYKRISSMHKLIDAVMQYSGQPGGILESQANGFPLDCDENPIGFLKIFHPSIALMLDMRADIKSRDPDKYFPHGTTSPLDRCHWPYPSRAYRLPIAAYRPEDLGLNILPHIGKAMQDQSTKKGDLYYTIHQHKDPQLKAQLNKVFKSITKPLLKKRTEEEKKRAAEDEEKETEEERLERKMDEDAEIQQRQDDEHEVDVYQLKRDLANTRIEIELGSSGPVRLGAKEMDELVRKLGGLELELKKVDIDYEATLEKTYNATSKAAIGYSSEMTVHTLKARNFAERAKIEAGADNLRKQILGMLSKEEKEREHSDSPMTHRELEIRKRDIEVKVHKYRGDRFDEFQEAAIKDFNRVVCVGGKVSEALAAAVKWGTERVKHSEIHHLCLKKEKMFKDISFFGEMVQSHLNYFEFAMAMSHAHTTAMKCILAMTHVYLPAKMHTNILLSGHAQVGKSFTLDKMDRSRIPGTVSALALVTPKSDATDGDRDDMIVILEELQPSMIGAENGKRETFNDTTAVFNNKLTSGRIKGKRYARDPITGKSITEMVDCRCSNVHIAACNIPVEQLSGPAGSRFNVEEWLTSKASNSNMLEKLSSSARPPEFLNLLKCGQDDYYIKQYLVCMLSKLILTGIMEGVRQEITDAVLFPVLCHAKRMGLGNTEAPRSIARIQMQIESVVMLRAVSRMFDSKHSKYRKAAVEGNLEFQTVDLLALEPNLVPTVEEVAWVLQLHSNEYEQEATYPVVQAILAMCINSLPTGSTFADFNISRTVKKSAINVESLNDPRRVDLKAPNMSKSRTDPTLVFNPDYATVFDRNRMSIRLPPLLDNNDSDDPPAATVAPDRALAMQTDATRRRFYNGIKTNLAGNASIKPEDIKRVVDSLEASEFVVPTDQLFFESQLTSFKHVEFKPCGFVHIATNAFDQSHGHVIDKALKKVLEHRYANGRKWVSGRTDPDHSWVWNTVVYKRKRAHAFKMRTSNYVGPSTKDALARSFGCVDRNDTSGSGPNIGRAFSDYPAITIREDMDDFFARRALLNCAWSAEKRIKYDYRLPSEWARIDMEDGKELGEFPQSLTDDVVRARMTMDRAVAMDDKEKRNDARLVRMADESKSSIEVSEEMDHILGYQKLKRTQSVEDRFEGKYGEGGEEEDDDNGGVDDFAGESLPAFENSPADAEEEKKAPVPPTEDASVVAALAGVRHLEALARMRAESAMLERIARSQRELVAITEVQRVEVSPNSLFSNRRKAPKKKKGKDGKDTEADEDDEEKEEMKVADDLDELRSRRAEAKDNEQEAQHEENAAPRRRPAPLLSAPAGLLQMNQNLQLSAPPPQGTHLRPWLQTDVDRALRDTTRPDLAANVLRAAHGINRSINEQEARDEAALRQQQKKKRGSPQADRAPERKRLRRMTDDEDEEQPGSRQDMLSADEEAEREMDKENGVPALEEGQGMMD